MKHLPIIILSLVFTFNAYAQENRGARHFQKGNYEKAIKHYERAFKALKGDEWNDRKKKSKHTKQLNRLDVQHTLNLANAYRLTNNWKEAEYWYSQIVYKEIDCKCICYYAKALYLNRKTDIGKEWADACDDPKMAKWFDDYLKDYRVNQ